MLESEKKKSNQKYILIGFVLILGLIIFKYTRPYMSGILGAATLYVIVIGQHRYLTKKLKFNKSLSALILVLEVLIFILIPLTGITLLVIDTFSGITIDPNAILKSISNFINRLEEFIGFNLFTPQNLSFLPKAGTNILQTVGTGVYSFVINVVVILFVLYFILYSNESFEQAIWEILPFEKKNKEILTEETVLIIKANAIGIPLMALIQGLFGYFGYLLFGVNNPILYAILTAFVSILPLVGTTIVWLPLGIGLIINGEIINGIGLIIYGAAIIGTVDNVARFLLQKKLANIHPLITVFGVLIGIPMFGFWGVVFGPLLLSLFLLFINMYRHEYVPGSKAEPRVTTRLKNEKVEMSDKLKNISGEINKLTKKVKKSSKLNDK